VNELTKEIKIKKILEIVNSKGITAYELSKSTGLNESGLNRIIKGEISNPHTTTIDKLYSYLYSSNTVSEETKKDIERIKTLENKVSNLQQNFKMLYDQLLFLQNSFLSQNKSKKENNKLG
jgi:transcriptional regulator with XRE-family HTH domain